MRNFRAVEIYKSQNSRSKKKSDTERATERKIWWHWNATKFVGALLLNCSVLEGHLPQKTLLRHRRSTETLHFAIVKRSPLSWTGKLYERGGWELLENLALNLSATTRLRRGKIRYWKWVRTKHWNCFYLGLPSHMLCLASSQIWVCCFSKDFGRFSLLVLYVPFILQCLALHFVLVWQAKKRSPIFTRASKFKPHLNLLNTKKTHQQTFKTQTVLRTTFQIFQKSPSFLLGFSHQKTQLSPKGSQPEAPLFVVLQDQELMESPVP